MKKRLSLILLLAVMALSFGWHIVVAQDSQNLTVFAASSLTDAFNEIGAAFKADHPGVDITFNYGGSSTLATQLVDGGAPADIFASANAMQMQAAVDGNRIAGKPVTFVKNRLVLIVPADNPAGIQSLHDLANSGVKLVVAAKGVPVRGYTDAMLEKLAADPLYGEAYRTSVVGNIVSEEENVRQVAAKVSLGEADAGIVYRSDVTPDVNDKVQALPIPDSLNTLATYPIAVTNDSANANLAKQFIDYVTSDAGQDTLVKWNFISVRIPELAYSVTLADDGKLHVDGQLFNPLALTVDDLRNNYSSKTLDVTYKSVEDTVSSTFTGILLWDILNSAQANFNPDVKNDKLSMFVVATGSDGYQAVIAWGEIDPDFGNQPIMIAYDEKGAPIPDDAVRLIVPGDVHGGRYVSGLVDLSLRDAPAVAK
ncbi:MAG: molybdate ABC transporter substrate-binding protein [Chloroflexota bacterium]